MKRVLLPLLCITLASCVRAHHPGRFVPPEEAAWFRFSRTLPDEGRQTVPGEMVAAMQLAMNAFLPWDAPPPPGADAVDRCLQQRQAWDVSLSPGDDGILFVNLVLGNGACQWGGSPLLDTGETYAVDVRSQRILSVRTAIGRVIPVASEEESARVRFPQQLSPTGLIRLDGNMAAAIQLAVDHFRPLTSKPPAEASLEEPCLQQPGAHDVTAAPLPGEVMLVRFDVNDAVCPPTGSPSEVGGVKYLSPAFITTYAIDIRTMRILGIENSTRQRIVN